MQAIDLSILIPCEPENVSLYCKMVLVDWLQLQARRRPLFDEGLVPVDSESECRTSLFTKPIAPE
jgi:hypothetical protein